MPNIVASMNDDATVMVKCGELSHILNQECYDHAFHLAISDVLYIRTGYEVDDDSEETDVADYENEKKR